MAETLAVRQKRKATRRGRDDSENACFTVATKDFTSWLLFSRSARAQKWTASFYERTQDQSCRDSFPFSKMKSFQREKIPLLFSISVPFTTVSYRFVFVLYNVAPVTPSIQIWHKRIFLWHSAPSIWIISNSTNGIIFLLFINVSNCLNRLDCEAICTSNGYWWSLYWN